MAELKLEKFLILEMVTSYCKNPFYLHLHDMSHRQLSETLR